MSQQAQAESLHQQSVKGFEELRGQLETLNSRMRKGDLSPEEYGNAEKEFDEKLSEVEKLGERARRLSLVDRTADALAENQENDRPEWLSVPGSVVGGGRRIELDRPHRPNRGSMAPALEPNHLVRCAKMAGVKDPSSFTVLSGDARAAVNKHFRNVYLQRHKGEGVEKLSQAEMLNIGPHIDRDGGMYNSVDFRNEVITKLRDTVGIRSRARVIATTASEVAFPVTQFNLSLKKVLAHRGKIDGTQTTKVGDIATKTQFTPHTFGDAIEIPEQLIEDSEFDFIGYLAEEIAATAFEDEERHFLTGSGNSEPLGILTGDYINKVDTLGTAGSAIVPEDIKTIPFSVRPVHRRGCAWMAPTAFYRKVAVMRGEEGGAGTGDFLYQRGLAAGDPATLNGYPALESTFFPDKHDFTPETVGADGDPLALFGDWFTYWIVDRKGLEMRVLPEIKALEYQVVYRFTKRYDAAVTKIDPWVILARKA